MDRPAAATRLSIDEPGKHHFVLENTPDGWELAAPSRDSLDPATRDRLLEAVADLWAERFLDAQQSKNLDALGLKKPDRSITLTRTDGRVVTLEVGKPTLELG